MHLIRAAILGLLASAAFAPAQSLPLPARSQDAIGGSAFMQSISQSELSVRESAIRAAILSGNVPSSLRQLHPVNITNISDDKTNIATFFVMPNYLAIGSDDDFTRIPMRPESAQQIADALRCTLPTRKMVDAIYAAAEIKLTPAPITPSLAMTTVPVFATHNDIVRTQLLAFGKAPSSTALVAGHKKDVVITTKLATSPGKVAIYGWHRTNGVAIQPLYLGHTSAWVDYSHGIRLVQQQMLLNGQTTTVARVLADPELSSLLSDEGVLTQPRYSTNVLNAAVITNSNSFGERTIAYSPAPEVEVEINFPPHISPDKPTQLILFALPNGNTTEQTIGRKLQPGDDWHYDIQHIGAQTRFLRAALTNQNIIVAYLESEMKSWPAWRRKYGNDSIPAIIQSIKRHCPTNQLQLTLTGHSGGGSFTFGYLYAVEKIPDDITRIAFLDSNYAYETTNHFTKLVNWLKQADATTFSNRSVPVPGHSNIIEPASIEPVTTGQFQAARNLNTSAPGDGRTPPGEGSAHYLCVLAYHDSIALLDGKTFVSERGGTWGRSHAMLEDLRAVYPFNSSTNAGLQTHTALHGRIEFLLKENPEKKILHTVQVERNGFIHAMLTATPLKNVGYEYLGDRAYTNWIQLQ